MKASLVGYGDAERDWLLLGRRGSGALELLAGLWRQNRDRSERSSFDSDDSILSNNALTSQLFWSHSQILTLQDSLVVLCIMGCSFLDS